MRYLALLAFVILCTTTATYGYGSTLVENNTKLHRVTMEDASHTLRLQLSYSSGCVLEQVAVRGKGVTDPRTGIYSGIKAGGKWYTTRDGQASPTIICRGDKVSVNGIRFGGGGIDVEETWTFTVGRQSIDWQIARKYLSDGVLDDTAFPNWNFASMSTWSGAILGTGGVAWGKLFDMPNATYGIHTDSATLWNRTDDLCLSIQGKAATGLQQALRFTRQPDDVFSLSSEVTKAALTPKYEQRRFLRDKQDVWSSFPVAKSDTITATYTLKALSYQKSFARGSMQGIDSGAITEILNTIGRIGAIDSKISGSNGWYSGYVCLHEPWLAQMSIAIDDPNYLRNYGATLDYQRDYAIAPDGMVKSRWAYGSWDARPGTYDARGFYECQWGRLMDTQTSYVINVADQFNLSGDRAWARRQKTACESVLDYLLQRDTNHNHLVEMETNLSSEHKASDWMDVIWASFESAFVNAQAYHALVEWANIEELLGDTKRAGAYRDYAAHLKESFNKPITEGGFWDPKNQWYVYWRDKDGSIRGNNLVLPVNFMAITYGICDAPARRAAILQKVEKEMVQQKLFCWPGNIYTYTPQETSHSTFPSYENGDIFLAWGECGVSAYAAYDPQIAVKYIKNVLDRYEKDGLAFQRYLRSNQAGEGDDILANNCNIVVGLYRSIYGIQPRYNRLYLEPHITPDMNGTRLAYTLRGQRLDIALSENCYAINCQDWTIQSPEAFGSAFGQSQLTYFHGGESKPAMTIRTATGKPLKVQIASWADEKRWIVSSGKETVSVTYTLYGLKPGTTYRLTVNGSLRSIVTANKATFQTRISPGKPQVIKLSVSLTSSAD